MSEPFKTARTESSTIGAWSCCSHAPRTSTNPDTLPPPSTRRHVTV